MVSIMPRLDALKAELKKTTPTADDWNNLGLKYHNATDGKTRDYEKANLCYLEALRLDPNHQWANYNLGQNYRCGQGVTKNLETARIYYEKAATHRHEDSKLRLLELEMAEKKEKNAAIKIQKVWRAFRARNIIALTIPQVLTHARKLKLWSAKPKAARQEIEEKLFAVHATNYFPLNGVIRVVDPKVRGGSHFRPTTHFALGELVQPHTDSKTTWDGKKYAVITPLKDLLPQLLNINCYDTYILGDFNLTKCSIVLVPEVEATQLQSTHQQLIIRRYNSSKVKLRQAIKKLIREQDGYDVSLFENEEKLGPWASAVFAPPKSFNLNTPEFFAPILSQNPSISFGKHCYSMFGSAYLFGVVDNALTQLGFSRDYYGHTYIEDPAFAKTLVTYALEKIENTLIDRNPNDSDILKLHIERAREGLQKLAVTSDSGGFAGDYRKALAARLMSWSDLHALIQKNTLSIHNQSAFLCLYAFQRTYVIGERDAIREGVMSVFSHNLAKLSETMRTQVLGTILWVWTNKDNHFWLGSVGFPYFQRRISCFVKRTTGIVANSEYALEAVADKACSIVRFWSPNQIDLPDAFGNPPLVQALIARDELKALELLHAGANVNNVWGRIKGWSITVPLVTIALRYGMSAFSDALLTRSNFIEWDQSDGWQNTPLCDAIVMRQESIALYLINRGARVDRRPNYSDVLEQDLLSLANRMGLKKVSEELRAHGCTSQQRDNNSSREAIDKLKKMYESKVEFFSSQVGSIFNGDDVDTAIQRLRSRDKGKGSASEKTLKAFGL